MIAHEMLPGAACLEWEVCAGCMSTSPGIQAVPSGTPSHPTAYPQAACISTQKGIRPVRSFRLLPSPQPYTNVRGPSQVQVSVQASRGSDLSPRGPSQVQVSVQVSRAWNLSSSNHQVSSL
ncbi:hypothetical protein JB92DRAFT_2851120 [Gautieria morchelliformis]|nr:hypothetical protein JB92DRAFT_2851120 [Gautieria morchelliformis]